jgi:tetratricopeptide (TPR) repeat protein
MGRVQDSLLAYKMVTRLEPGNAEAWLDYADTLAELGYLRQSLKSYDKALEANPHLADVHYGKARVLLVLNRFYEAVEGLKMAFRLNPALRQEFEEEFPAAKGMKELRGFFKK